MNIKVRDFPKLFRLQEWVDSKLIWLLIIVGIYSIDKQLNFTSINITFIKHTVLFFLYLSLVALANDYSDLDADKLVGKIKPIALLTNLQVSIILFSGSFFYSILASINNFSFDITLFLYSLIFLFFGLFYSLKPIRFKEKGLLGIIVGSTIQRTLPILLFIAIKNYWNSFSVTYLTFVTVLGIKQMFIHQLKDYFNDKKSRIKTFVNGRSQDRSIIFIKTLNFLEWSLFTLTIILTPLINKYIITSFIVYLILLELPIKVNKKKNNFDIYSSGNNKLSSFYFLFLPLTVSILLVWLKNYYILLFVVLFFQKWHLSNFLKRVVS